MFDAAQIADKIARWPDLGLTLPKSITSAIAVFRAAREVPPPSEAFNRLDLTVGNVEETISRLSQVLTCNHRFLEARNRVVHALASEVIVLARGSVDDMLKQLRPTFDSAVEQLKGAADLLPNHSRLTHETLINAGGPAVQAYAQAQEAAALLSALDTWLASLSDILGGDHAAHLLRVLDPQDKAEYSTIAKDTNQLVKTAGGAWLIAAQEGIGFEMRTPQQASDRKAEIDAMEIPGQVKGLNSPRLAKFGA
ncbi:hypothetical protein [Mycobacterium sp. URHB0021]